MSVKSASSKMSEMEDFAKEKGKLFTVAIICIFLIDLCLVLWMWV